MKPFSNNFNNRQWNKQQIQLFVWASALFCLTLNFKIGEFNE